jgi:hypothetical protein
MQKGEFRHLLLDKLEARHSFSRGGASVTSRLNVPVRQGHEAPPPRSIGYREGSLFPPQVLISAANMGASVTSRLNVPVRQGHEAPPPRSIGHREGSLFPPQVLISAANMGASVTSRLNVPVRQGHEAPPPRSTPLLPPPPSTETLAVVRQGKSHSFHRVACRPKAGHFGWLCRSLTC